MKLFLIGAVTAALLHITPTVVLLKRNEVVARLMPGADQFTARELHLSSGDARQLHDAVGWEPADGVITFYVGKHQQQEQGALLFQRVDSPHGPLELAVAFEPGGGRIRGVEVTKATVETKPWVAEALRAGLTAEYRGMALNGTPAGAAKVRPNVGAMPAYMAELTDKGVMHAAAAYRLFYGRK
jgi:antitoxin (DNA-binding transcriptional repressor) of toxin-antitoxin stability system